MNSYEEDPHPSPPHKGEGTLPHATPLGAGAEWFAEVSAYQVSLPLVGRD
jgi:hypothetical protein